MMLLKFTGFLAALHLAQAQSLLTALSTYPELSQFSNLLSTVPALANGLLSFSATEPKTILIPNNDAFLGYKAATGADITSADPALLANTLQYHVLNGSYSANDFSAEKGVTIPTLLTVETYNNRSAGAALSSAAAGEKNGQVVFISPQGTSGTFKVRQLDSDAALVRSGLASDVNLTTTEGSWDGGKFHIIDGFLTLPQICTKTIENRSLTSLSASLNRTGLAPVLDSLANVTCLGPIDSAFLAAGSPDTKLSVEDLTGALMFHTIPQPLYSNFLESGQMFKTAGGDDVRVTITDGEIFFNDAKVLQRNVLTNNGLIHVLDKIMSPLEKDEPTNTTATSSASPSPTSNSTATTTPFTEVPANAAVRVIGTIEVAGLLTCVVLVMSFLI